MNVEYVRRLINEYNPHIRGKGTANPEFKRELYHEISQWLAKKQIIAIVGLRRVGKTTLMRQLMEGVQSESAFFSFDEEETQSKDVLSYVLDYAQNVLKSRYVFLDEIHYVEDWEGVLKRHYDQRGVKFIVSGSESLELRRAKAALAGRIVTFHLPPMSFREYLGLKGRRSGLDGASLEHAESLEKTYDTLIAEKERFEEEFLEYLYKGAFPELANEEDETIIRKYTEDLVVKKIIFQDIPSIFEVKRRDLLLELFKYACGNSSNLYNINNLSSAFAANADTITNYLSYLRSAFLIRTAETYSKSQVKRLRKSKKIYVTHPSLALAALGYGRNMLIEKVLGQYVETAFAGECFWRDAQKNEVDVILGESPPIPLEIKYQSHIGRGDMKGLLKFMERHKIARGFVATKNTMEKLEIDGKEIVLAPAWLLLLAMPKSQS